MNPRHRFEPPAPENRNHPAYTAMVRARAARLDGCLADVPSAAGPDAAADLRHRAVPGGHDTGTPVDVLGTRDYETSSARPAPMLSGLEVTGLLLLAAGGVLAVLTVFFLLWHWSPVIACAVLGATVGVGAVRARARRGGDRR